MTLVSLEEKDQRGSEDLLGQRGSPDSLYLGHQRIYGGPSETWVTPVKQGSLVLQESLAFLVVLAARVRRGVLDLSANSAGRGLVVLPDPSVMLDLLVSQGLLENKDFPVQSADPAFPAAWAAAPASATLW